MTRKGLELRIQRYDAEGLLREFESAGQAPEPVCFFFFITLKPRVE